MGISTDRSGTASLELEDDGITSSPALATIPSQERPAQLCPKCGGTLRFPETHGMCLACGYCRWLENNGVASADNESTSSKTPRSDFDELILALRHLPGWSWWLLGGTVGIVLFSAAASYFLPAHGFARALWATTQAAVGVIVLLSVQFWTLCLVMPGDARLGFLDVIYSPRLWGAAIKRLPTTRKPVCLGAWSFVGVLSALLLVGGLTYWLHSKKRPPRSLSLIAAIAAAKPEATSGKTLEESVEDFAKTQDMIEGKDSKDSPADDDAQAKDPKDTKTDTDEDKRPTVACFIIGYVPGEKNTVAGLVLATENEGQLRYAGVAYQGLSAQNSKSVLELLSPHVQARPVMTNLEIKAIWVKPVVGCEVHQSGVAASGLLVDPSFKRFVE